MKVVNRECFILGVILTPIEALDNLVKGEQLMKKILIIGAVVMVTVVALGVVGFAYAQSQQPGSSANDVYGRGGKWGGHGSMMGGRGVAGENGLLHPYMINAIAEALDMTTEDLQARLDSGDTCWTIAQEKGLTQEEFYTLMKDARTDALTQAVADEVITQDQADWMLERMNQMQGFGSGTGDCQGGGMRGRGRWNSQPTGTQG